MTDRCKCHGKMFRLHSVAEELTAYQPGFQEIHGIGVQGWKLEVERDGIAYEEQLLLD